MHPVSQSHITEFPWHSLLDPDRAPAHSPQGVVALRSEWLAMTTIGADKDKARGRKSGLGTALTTRKIHPWSNGWKKSTHCGSMVAPYSSRSWTFQRGSNMWVIFGWLYGVYCISYYLLIYILNIYIAYGCTWTCRNSYACKKCIHVDSLGPVFFAAKGHHMAHKMMGASMSFLQQPKFGLWVL